MRTYRIFSRARDNAEGKETEITNKRGCCKCLYYFEKVSRRQRTQGPLKRTFDAKGASCASIKSDSRLNWLRKRIFSLPFLIKSFCKTTAA